MNEVLDMYPLFKPVQVIEQVRHGDLITNWHWVSPRKQFKADEATVAIFKIKWKKPQ